MHGLFNFPSGNFNNHYGRTQSISKQTPFVSSTLLHTNYFYNSFVPHTVSIWNTLPVSLVSNSYIPHLRSQVWMHIILYSASCKYLLLLPLFLSLMRDMRELGGINLHWMITRILSPVFSLSMKLDTLPFSPSLGTFSTVLLRILEFLLVWIQSQCQETGVVLGLTATLAQRK